jgi:hypothetical protein
VASPALASQPASISKQGHFVIKDDNKVLVLPLAAHQAALTPAPGSLSPLQPSLLPKPSLQTTPSSSKTYCIQRNPNLQNSPTVLPIQPKSIAPSPLTPTPTPALAPAAPTAAVAGTAAKQNTVVGIQSLGANTVTIKDGQLIVQGPDHAAATQIAKLVSSGAAKLVNLNGKQLLLTTAPAKEQPAAVEAAAPPPPREPTPPPPPRVLSPPPMLTVTAQLVQKPLGLQEVQLEQAQLMTIQQQVKQQLLKQQALARQQGKVPPTKVPIQLSDGHLAKKTEPPSSQPKDPAPQPTQATSPQQQFPLGQQLTGTGEQGDKFTLTEDYRQQTIKDALKGGNLTPKLQEKLMSEMDGCDMPESLTKNGKRNSSRRAACKGLWDGVVMDPASGEPRHNELQPLEFSNGRGGKGGKTGRGSRSDTEVLLPRGVGKKGVVKQGDGRGRKPKRKKKKKLPDIDDLLKRPSDIEKNKEDILDQLDIEIMKSQKKHEDDMVKMDEEMKRKKRKVEEQKIRFRINALLRDRIKMEFTEAKMRTVVRANLGFLQSIQAGEIPSARHKAFYRSVRTRQALNFMLITDPFTDDQVNWTLEEMSKMWMKNEREKMDKKEYVWNVMLPECFIKVYGDKFGVSRAEAEVMIGETPLHRRDEPRMETDSTEGETEEEENTKDELK